MIAIASIILLGSVVLALLGIVAYDMLRPEAQPSHHEVLELQTLAHALDERVHWLAKRMEALEEHLRLERKRVREHIAYTKKPRK